jgi:hypothetical protein
VNNTGNNWHSISMKWIAALCFTTLFALQASTQYDYFAFESGIFQPEMTAWVYEEHTTLKSRPATDSRDLAHLTHGDRVLVMHSTGVQHQRNGVIHYWYNVSWTNDSGRVITGFIPGNDLALGAVTFQLHYRRDLLLFRIMTYNPSEAYTMEAKVVRNGQTVAQIETPFIDFHLNPAYFNYSVSVLKNIQTRIDSISEVAEITFYHLNQDRPSGTLYLIWSGEHLDRICETMYLHEPLLFIYESYIVYPGQEGVKPGTVKHVEIIREYNEEKEDYIVVEKIGTVYVWDGKLISKLVN